MPERFATLKRSVSHGLSARQLLISDSDIIGDEALQAKLTASWADLTEHLGQASAQIAREKQKAIPQVDYTDFVNGSQSSKIIQEVKKRGVVVVKSVVPREKVCAWLILSIGHDAA